MDDLGLIETADRFGEGVVVTVADASDRRFDASCGYVGGYLTPPTRLLARFQRKLPGDSFHQRIYCRPQRMTCCL
jgi:hypothetical protein